MTDTTTTPLKLSVPGSCYKDALFSQSACNLSGLIHSLHRIVTLIWTEARANDLGTDYVNQHPICRLYAEQIAFLTGAGIPDDGNLGASYNDALRICQERAGQREPAGEQA